MTNNQNKRKTKISGFYMKKIILVINQIKGNICGTKTICDVNMLLGNTMEHIFSCPVKYSSWLFTAYYFKMFIEQDVFLIAVGK